MARGNCKDPDVGESVTRLEEQWLEKRTQGRRRVVGDENGSGGGTGPAYSGAI